MSTNGHTETTDADGHVLRWPGRVFTVEDMRRNLNGHRELILTPRAVLTPSAAEELRHGGIEVTRQTAQPVTQERPRWGYAQERPSPLVRSAVQSLNREGLELHELSNGERESGRWAQALAECVQRGDCRGGVVFCQDPGLVCCVANKVTGLRAVPVVTVLQAARATLTFGANLVAVEVPGRTFFEVRQILRTLCLAGDPACPDGVACTLRELDGHAHR